MTVSQKRRRKSSGKPAPPRDDRHIMERLGPDHPLVARHRLLGDRMCAAIRAQTNLRWGHAVRGSMEGYSSEALDEILSDTKAERREIEATLDRMDRRENPEKYLEAARRRKAVNRA